MRSRFLLPVLTLVALAACSDLTKPDGAKAHRAACVTRDITEDCDSTQNGAPVTIAGAWVYSGDVSFFSRIHLAVTEPEAFDTTYLSGSVDADLRCAPGASTFAIPSTPTPFPCHVLGLITDGRQTGNSIRLTLSFEGPMGAVINGTLNPDGTFTGSITVYANLDVSSANGLIFTRP